MDNQKEHEIVATVFAEFAILCRWSSSWLGVWDGQKPDSGIHHVEIFPSLYSLWGRFNPIKLCLEKSSGPETNTLIEDISLSHVMLGCGKLVWCLSSSDAEWTWTDNKPCTQHHKYRDNTSPLKLNCLSKTSGLFISAPSLSQHPIWLICVPFAHS